MTKSKMEINSSLLNDKSFKYVKESIEEISAIDDKGKFRVNLIEYINDTAENNDDMFFFDMLEFTRFLNPNDDAVAYTTPDRLIYLNAPTKFGEKYREWDFVYCHECLHQLWDTFAVGDQIKKEGVEYNHYVLNIASDCVINDYLAYYRKNCLSELLQTIQHPKIVFELRVSCQNYLEVFVSYCLPTDKYHSMFLDCIEAILKYQGSDHRCQPLGCCLSWHCRRRRLLCRCAGGHGVHLHHPYLL